MARKIKGKTFLKRKIKGLERENTVHPGINQIVIKTKVHHQKTQILITGRLWTHLDHLKKDN